MKLANRIALITGGGRGIGKAIGLKFAGEGAQVILAARSVDQVKQAADEIASATAARVLPLVCDVTETGSIDSLFEAVKESFGRGADIMVNNAGIAESAPLTRTDNELWQRHLAVNLSGTFYCMRAALPEMIE